MLIFLMPQMSILHVSFHGFDYSKALYVSHRHLVGFIIAVAAILVLIAFILHSPSRIKSSFCMFSYRLQAQSISLSALGCRPWQPILKHAKPALTFTKLISKSCNYLYILMWKLNKVYECLCQEYRWLKVQRIKKTLTIKEAAFVAFRK